MLVNLARDADPRIAQLEDYHPYDTTLTVCARWDYELYRILPGQLSRPGRCDSGSPVGRIMYRPCSGSSPRLWPRRCC